MSEARRCNWLPLESSPEVLNPFVERLGLPKGWGFADVFGLDEELLMMVPQPCVAVCLLYPSKNISHARRADLLARRQELPPPPPDLFFMQQHDSIGNACGSIACLHAVANAAVAGNFTLNEGPLSSFMQGTLTLDANGRGWALLEATGLQELSDSTAAAGETEGAGTDDANDSHFISFVNFGGRLYELDGRCFDKATKDAVAFPVPHGETTPQTFLSDVARVIRDEFMTRDPGSIAFNVVALVKMDE